MLEVTLEVTLTLRGPVLTRSTAMGDPGVDAPVARDKKGTAYLPKSLVYGKLKESWSRLSEITKGRFPRHGDYRATLGIPSPKDGSGNEPRRKRLSFTDFTYCGQSDKKDNLGYRIRIDPERGSVAQGALLVMESPFAAGESVPFRGQISFFARDKAEADAIADDIGKGLRWTTSLGALRTAGFGRLDKVEITSTPTRVAVTPGPVSGPPTEGLHIRLEFDEPFCVARPPKVKNVFESEEVLSGAVLRGAIATTLKMLAGLPQDAVISKTIPGKPWAELGQHFNTIAISHGFPLKKDAARRPVVAPQSLVKYDKGSPWCDIALFEGPCLIKGAAPEFAIDWKSHEDVDADFGWSHPGRELRVRTKIDETKRRAEEHMLFAYEMVDPTGYVWVARIDLRGVPPQEQAAVAAQLRAIFTAGLYSLGKTKARAKVTEGGPVPPIFESNIEPVGKQWVLTLQTPALLCDPATLNETSGDTELGHAYQSCWDDISGKTSKLVRFFARQSLAGRYLWYRFRSQNEQSYYPFLLSDPGSVFVLEAVGDTGKAIEVIKRWASHGLELPQWAKARYRGDWKTNPFLPGDGFGQVAINLECHTNRLPEKGAFTHV